MLFYKVNNSIKMNGNVIINTLKCSFIFVIIVERLTNVPMLVTDVVGTDRLQINRVTDLVQNAKRRNLVLEN